MNDFVEAGYVSANQLVKVLGNGSLTTKLDIEANALLCMGYVDHTAGLTYEALALANYCDGDYSVVWEAKDISLKIRSGSVANNVLPNNVATSFYMSGTIAEYVSMLEK